MRTALWLLAAQLALLLYGAFAMPVYREFEAMNAMALFRWLAESPARVTWWLWASVGVLALLAANTLACSVESLARKRRGRHWLLVVSPQVIHLGFLFMLMAHLVSSAWGMKGMVGATEGMLISIHEGLQMRVGRIDVQISPEGFPLDWGAGVEFYCGGAKVGAAYVAPNRPAFFRGYGVYIKNVSPAFERAALIEVTREPGAPWALAGGALFTVGTALLFGLKILRER